jgi:hypothetical protein
MAVLKFAAGLTAGPQLGTGVAAPACATLHSERVVGIVPFALACQ